MAKATQPVTVEDLSEQVSLLKNDIANLTSTMGEYGKAKTSQVKASAINTADHLATASRDRAVQAQHSAEEFVRTQPTAALGIAAGLGFLVGLLTARR